MANVAKIPSKQLGFAEAPSLWVEGSSIVGAGATVAIDTVALADFLAVKYFIAAKNSGSTKTKVLDMLVLKENGAVKDTIKDKMGTADIAFSATIISGNLEIRATNNESSSITVLLTKLILN